MRKFIMLIGLTMLVGLVFVLPAAATHTTASVDMLTATLPVSVTRCPGAPVARLKVNDTARPVEAYNTLWVSIYSTEIHTILYRAKGDTYTVLAGPFCGVGPYNWYQVKYKDITGFITEGTGSTYWSEPVSAVSATPTGPAATSVPTTPIATPVPTTVPLTPGMTPTAVSGACAGAPAPRLKVNDTAQVAQAYSSLRQSIGSNIILKVFLRANNDRFTVIGGPYCGYGPYNWYQVQQGNLVGYVTEGTGSTYWIEPAAAISATPQPTLPPTPNPTPSS